MSVGLEHPEYVAMTKASWPVPPESMSVIEYFGTGDTFFAGDADDRPLGLDGNILSPGYQSSSIAQFKTIEEAHQAALKITNRRPNTVLGVGPRWTN